MRSTEATAGVRLMLRACVVVAVSVSGVGMAPRVAAQAPTEVVGEAILKHPAGQLAIKSAELLSAGKIDEAIQLRTKEEQADWKKAPAGERKEMSSRMRERAPAPAAFAEAIRKAGVLTVYPDRAILRVEMGKVGSAIAFYEKEGAEWRATTGPMVIEGAGEPANEVRVEGAGILEHAIGALALQYADLVHAGKWDDVMQLTSAAGQAAWKSEPASERAASAAFRKKMLPARPALLQGIKTGGVLIIEDGERATLNVVQVAPGATTPGTVTSSSTTTAIGFVLENGVWKLAR